MIGPNQIVRIVLEQAEMKMSRYWYDYMLEDDRKFEDNKSTTYDSDNLNELSSWRNERVEHDLSLA